MEFTCDLQNFKLCLKDNLSNIDAVEKLVERKMNNTFMLNLHL